MLILTNSDKKARCLCGFPLFIDNIHIYPITVRRIIEKGESQYNISLMLIISLKKAFEMIAKELDTKKLDELTDFELILVLSSIHEDFCKQIAESIEFFVDYKIKFNKTAEAFDFYTDDELIGSLTKDNYDDFVSIIKLQNYDKAAIEELDAPPVSKKMAAMLKQRDEYREKLRKAKGQSTDVLTYVDYISILMAKSSEMDVEKALNMTVYAFFTYLERLAMIDSYEIGIQQLMAGAKPNQVDLKHWLSSL